MTQRNNLTTPSNWHKSPVKPILTGAGIGLIIISFFVFGAKADPDWGKLWMIRPLVITPAAGAIGGAFYYFMNHLTPKGLNKTIAAGLSVIAFIIALWVGVVLGLDSTLWD